MKRVLFVFLFFYSTISLGRSPAVHPITGLSIDEQKVIKSQLAKGFDFSSPKLMWLEKNNETSKTQNIIQVIGLLFLLALPYAIWHRLLANVGKTDSPKTPEKKVEKQDDDDVVQKKAA